MELPLVTASRRRKKEISWGARPGFVGDELRILEMWIGRPVSVDRISRCVKDRCPVNRRNSGVEFDILLLFWGVSSESQCFQLVAKVQTKINFLPLEKLSSQLKIEGGGIHFSKCSCKWQFYNQGLIDNL